MSTSPLQNIINVSSPEQRTWIFDRVRPDPAWREKESDERHQLFYAKQWALLEAASDPEDASVPDWFRQRRKEAAALVVATERQEKRNDSPKP